MYKKQMLLGGLLRIKGMRQMIKSIPYQAERKAAMKGTAKAYSSKEAQSSTKDKKFLRGLQKLDAQRAKTTKLLDMSQFLVKEARKAGRKDMTRVGRKIRRGVVDYGKNVSEKAGAMINRKTKKKKLN
jgi:hypothetical protein|tara:strand:- start:3 stop:386 length:384 start_codon:yes stop_codon:yes gene_type:complete